MNNEKLIKEEITHFREELSKLFSEIVAYSTKTDVEIKLEIHYLDFTGPASALIDVENIKELEIRAKQTIIY